MSKFSGIPNDLQSCQELIVLQQKQIEELQVEQEKLRKLLSQLVNGNRSEKRVISGPDQVLLPFESDEEFEAAQAEAEAEAEPEAEAETEAEAEPETGAEEPAAEEPEAENEEGEAA